MADLWPEVFAAAAEQPISVEIKMADGIFVKSMAVARKGTFIPTHAHTYDHLSMLAVGSVRVWVDGALQGEYEAPRGIDIPAGVKHTFETLVDGVLIYCIHNIKEAEEVEVNEENHIVGSCGGCGGCP